MYKVFVAFDVHNEERFSEALQRAFENDENVVGIRTDVTPTQRASLRQFADAMEAKLRKNDHKTSWRELPVAALFRMLQVEIEEYKVAHEFLTAGEARKELVDVANYALILWDRLSLEQQEKKIE